jgi:hypothetical protein
MSAWIVASVSAETTTSGAPLGSATASEHDGTTGGNVACRARHAGSVLMPVTPSSAANFRCSMS